MGKTKNPACREKAYAEKKRTQRRNLRSKDTTSPPPLSRPCGIFSIIFRKKRRPRTAGRRPARGTGGPHEGRRACTRADGPARGIDGPARQTDAPHEGRRAEYSRTDKHALSRAGTPPEQANAASPSRQPTAEYLLRTCEHLPSRTSERTNTGIYPCSCVRMFAPVSTPAGRAPRHRRESPRAAPWASRCTAAPAGRSCGSARG